MNTITLKGIIKDIEYSHTINDVEFYKANVVTAPNNGIEYIVPIKFKRFSNKHQNNEPITLTGNLRSYSTKVDDKNRVQIYVFTYMDEVEETDKTNYFELDGRICKKQPINIDAKSGKCSISFIVANNIFIEGTQKHLNSYLPCIAYGKNAKEISGLPIGTKVELYGHIRSRQYRKTTTDNSYDVHVTHELIVTDMKVIRDA